MAGQPKRRAMIEQLHARMLDYYELDAVDYAIADRANTAPTHLDYICDWLADGRTIQQLAQEMDVSRGWITGYLDRTFGDALCDQRLAQARTRASHSIAEEAIFISDAAATTSVDVARNGLRARSRQWIAERWNPTQYGSTKGVNVAITVGSLHLDALRTTPARVTSTLPMVVEASRSIGPDHTQAIAAPALDSK